MLIDNFFAALYSKPVTIGDINPLGELSYKGYSRIQFCAVNGRSIDTLTFSKALEDSVNLATHVVTMTGNGKVLASALISHNKDYQ